MKNTNLKLKIDKIVGYIFLGIGLICASSIIFIVLFILIKGVKPFIANYGTLANIKILKFLFGPSFIKGKYGVFGLIINTIVRDLALNFQKVISETLEEHINKEYHFEYESKVYKCKVIYSDSNVFFNGVIITMEDVTEKDKLARTKRDFFQSKSLGGTGLGLAIVKHICEIYGHKIKLDSTLDKGTTVTIKFL